MLTKIALVSSIVLPLWNIPLIMRMYKRKSSADVSMSWAIGVWVCFALMIPSAVQSTDIVWKTFSITNMTLFTLVVITTIIYRTKK